MGLFKKKQQEPQEEKLVDGQLPFGWIGRHHEFTDNISEEYRFFLQKWTETFGGDQNRTYEALKSFVLYMQDVRSLCASKGECFEEWSRILFTDDYYEKRLAELNELEQQLK